MHMTDSFEGVRNQVVAELSRLGGTLRTGKSGAGDAGRVLRAHLVVENCLRRHIQALNPNLGPIEKLGLGFDKLRIAAFGMKICDVAWANEQLVALNQIRNKLAHQVDAKITDEDILLLRRDVDALLRDSLARSRWPEIAGTPVAVIETWAMIFGMFLALEQAMDRNKCDLVAQQGELDAVAVQLFRELFDVDVDSSARGV